MALELYDQLYIELNGKLLAENTSLSVDLTSDDQDVMTTVKGWSGVSPSPDMRTISGEGVIASTKGIEVDMEQWKVDRTEVTARVIFGGSGKSFVSKGVIKKVSASAGVGQTAKVTFEFTGTPSVFK